MVLRSPLTSANLIGDPAVSHFNEQAKALRPDSARLEQDRERYSQFLLTELFNFNELNDQAAGFETLIPNLEKDIIQVSDKFIQNITLNKIQNAANYFQEKLRTAIENLHLQIPNLIGTSKDKAGKADRMLSFLMHKAGLMEYFSKNEFSVDIYLSLKKDKKKLAIFAELLNAKANEKLFQQLLNWREQTAAKEKVMPNMLFSELTLATIAEKLPPLLKNLSAIKGIGPQKAQKYGPELISLIRAYQQELTGSAEQHSLF